MKRQLLLRVEESFLIAGRGLVVVPHLEPIPQGFRPFADSVVVRHPDSSENEMTARFDLSHFRLLEGGGKWMIAVSFPVDSKQLVPIGSELWVSASAFNILNHRIETAGA